MSRLHARLPVLCAVSLIAACASGYGGPISSSGGEALSPQERRLQAAESRLAELSRRLDAVNLTGMDQENLRLRDDIRAMRGEMERLRYDFDQAQRRAKEQYLDLDRRLQRFENPTPNYQQPAAPGFPPPASFGGQPPTSVPGPGPSGAAPQPQFGGAPAPAVSTGPAAVAPAAVVISQGSGATPEEEGAYLTAFDSLKNGKYDDAIRGFRAVLEKWPNGRYADSALYWTGEAYYVKRDYKSALTAFQTVGQRFATSSRAPDSLLKVGLTQIELKQEAEGRATLQRVVQMYPQTNAARLAQQRLEPPKSAN